MENLFRIEDLVNNPSPRVPVCLCLDTSGSMGDVIDGTFQRTGQIRFIDGQRRELVQGGITAIDELQKGVESFYQELLSDEVAMYSAEVCIVTFNGEGAQLVTDFCNLERQSEIPRFRASGETPMGEAVNLSLDCLERRKEEYKQKGVDYFQPWIVLMTDGTPNGSQIELDRAIRRTTQMVQDRKLTIFPIGIGPNADMNTLQRFSPNRQPLKLKGTRFKEFFSWLSQSVSTTSQSLPGERIPLDLDHIETWADFAASHRPAC